MTMIPGPRRPTPADLEQAMATLDAVSRRITRVGAVLAVAGAVNLFLVAVALLAAGCLR